MLLMLMRRVSYRKVGILKILQCECRSVESPLHSRNAASTPLTNIAESNNKPSSHVDNDDEEDDEEEAAEEEDKNDEVFLVEVLVVVLVLVVLVVEGPTAEGPGPGPGPPSSRAGGCMAPGMRVEAPTLRSKGRMSPDGDNGGGGGEERWW